MEGLVPPQNSVDRTIVDVSTLGVNLPPEQHLRRILRKYLEYYHGSRTHLALDKDAPEPRKRESTDGGNVIALPMVGGLHHRYTRRAA
jgi:hypothetical protein